VTDDDLPPLPRATTTDRHGFDLWDDDAILAYMTLLDEFDRMVFRPGIPVGTYERIRRAIAIAQAVDWYSTYDPGATDNIFAYANKLLKGKDDDAA
jgi:hypothetical protein